jgi:D-alanine--poly(phosphoribitol) ligase subunit 2
MSQTPQEIADKIELFVRRRFQVPDDDDLFDRDVHLWEEGYVDSTGIVELIAFLEETFSVEVPDDALFDPDFTSVNGLARLVQRLGDT